MPSRSNSARSDERNRQSAQGKTQPTPRTARRLDAAVREQQIVAGAVQFFAERGFDGRTRDLAESLGVTQPLLYRYFPTKRTLIDRVFREVYLRPFEMDWSGLLTDRSRPLGDRLETFYARYSQATYRYEWIRIYMFAGLMGEDLNKSYIAMVEDKILRVICSEVRHHCGLPSAEVIPISELELEHIWVLHGGLFYYAVRKYIYGARISDDFTAIVRRAVSAMLDGTKSNAARH
jgi:AcrR family transcriptional regulator